ncbi:hypothetical protein M7I_1466 [Glarea lozoyensis 74030]|uniref:Uncharacterized protein n=1 Tax=Glarea lozoyensis (strain ATCC 74030 / MF5533) TaxID=1104152 RepID=H0EG58_GLAL7|nr:hypothetical protein M7I_1466 [Glarea lozoyensis 74030]
MSRSYAWAFYTSEAPELRKGTRTAAAGVTTRRKRGCRGKRRFSNYSGHRVV